MILPCVGEISDQEIRGQKWAEEWKEKWFVQWIVKKFLSGQDTMAGYIELSFPYFFLLSFFDFSFFFLTDFWK